MAKKTEVRDDAAADAEALKAAQDSAPPAEEAAAEAAQDSAPPAEEAAAEAAQDSAPPAEEAAADLAPALLQAYKEGVECVLEQLCTLLNPPVLEDYAPETGTIAGDVQKILPFILTARFGEAWRDLPTPAAIAAKAANDADAAAEAARAAAVEPAKPLSAQALIDRINHIEGLNRDSHRDALMVQLVEDGLRMEDAGPLGTTLAIDGLEVTAAGGLAQALRSWCETARIKILREEAV